jgi:deazaflavin-dependent oxidoreductase (nitroreductase family)
MGRSSVDSDDYCYVTTKGRRTGHPHRIEIWYAVDGSVLYLLAGGGQSSDWVRNAISEPAVRVEFDGKIHSGLARMVEDPDEAARARTLVFEKYAPRSSDDLSEWRDRATPVAIEMTST